VEDKGEIMEANSHGAGPYTTHPVTVLKIKRDTIQRHKDESDVVLALKSSELTNISNWKLQRISKGSGIRETLDLVPP